MEIKNRLLEAVRQYKHNNDSGGFVIAFENDEVNKLVNQLVDENAKLREMLSVVSDEYQELLEKIISHIGSCGTSSLSQARQLLIELEEQDNE